MKKMIKTAFLTAFALLGVSCAQEKMISEGGEQGVPVEIRFEAATRGAMPDDRFDARDNVVASLRVLIYDSNSGVLKWNFSSPADLSVGNLASGAKGSGQDFELDIFTGTYDFVFVANEGDLDDDLAALTPGSHMAALRAMTFDAAAFARSKNIPMVSHYPDVTVSRIAATAEPGQVSYTDPFDGGELSATEWKVRLQRVGVRLDITLDFDEAQQTQFDASAGLTIGGVPTAAWLLPRGESSNLSGAVGYTIPSNKFDADHHISVILPERLLQGSDNAKANAMMLTALGRSGAVCYWADGQPTVADYSLSRNLFLDLSISIAQVELEVDVLDWNNGGLGNYAFDGVNYFHISERQVDLNAEGETVTVSIKTDIPDFTMNLNGGYTEIVADNSLQRYFSKDGFVYTLSDPVGDEYTLKIVASANPVAAPTRHHVWRIVAKRLDMSFAVSQLPLPAPLAPPGVIGYIVGTNTLTLKGSREYAALDGIKAYADVTFDGLENETVYVAYFKFGSLVATASDPLDRVAPFFEPEDVLAVPSEWMSLADARAEIGTNWYQKIPMYEDTDWYFQDGGGVYTKRNVSHPDYHNEDNFKLGKGDPCMYYFGTEHGGGWRLPAGGSLNADPAIPNALATGGWNGGTFGKANESLIQHEDVEHTGAHSTWFPSGSLGADIPAGMRAGDGTPGHEADWSMFLPAAGMRHGGSSTTTNGPVGDQNFTGWYWTSTAWNLSSPYHIYFGDTYVMPARHMVGIHGNTIRCVRDQNE